jgi:hypothetical protein
VKWLLDQLFYIWVDIKHFFYGFYVRKVQADSNFQKDFKDAEEKK